MQIKLTQKFFIDVKNLNKEDKRLSAKIFELISDISANGPLMGIGKPEKLKHLKGCYSRRISKQHRLIYRLNNGILEIVSWLWPL